MKLIKANRFLRSAAKAASGLWVSAKTSSAIEGIRQPFARDANTGQFKDIRTFTEHWKLRASKSGR
jgi:hypothetical protein